MNSKLGYTAAVAALWVSASVCSASTESAPIAQPVMMDAAWAAKACEGWNADAALTKGLYESGWADNHKGRGFRVIQIYRKDCNAEARIELRIAPKDGRAQCIYGGAAQTKLTDNDFVMYADTRRWQELGRGEYGPMKAMMFGRLLFDGPKWEAMQNMSAFEGFLKLVGTIPGDARNCPVLLSAAPSAN